MFLALILGVAVCVFYEIIKAFRLSFDLPSPVIFMLDIGFCAITGVATFCFLLVRCKGNVRWFVLISAAAAFLLCRLISSKIISAPLSKIIKLVKSIVLLILNRIVSPVCSGVLMIFNKILGGLLNKIIKTSKVLKKQLHKVRMLMYNYFELKYKTKGRGSRWQQETQHDKAVKADKPARKPQAKIGVRHKAHRTPLREDAHNQKENLPKNE